jgi:CYTH domain-containing protein
MIRTGEDDGAAPKYALIERERRWLVDLDRRPALGDLPAVLIEDLYIEGTRLRLRRMTDSAGLLTRKLTKKYEAADPTSREIVTAYLVEGEYAVFARLPGRRIVKRRYPVEWEGKRFSLDIFKGALAPLELLEIEGPDAASLAAIIAPPWTVREISHDPAFEGGSLASLER